MDTILQRVEDYILILFSEQLPNHYFYHNYTHTQRVVKHINELVSAEGLGERESEILQIAGWFHDAGYIRGRHNHEEESARMAEAFLQAEGYPKDKTDAVKACILITKKTGEPENLLQKIICDADFSHFASKNYPEISDLLREEFRLVGGKNFTDTEWIETNIRMFEEHHKFYTSHAIATWQPQKSKNLLKLKKNLSRLLEKKEKDKLKKADLKRKKKKAETPERGVETLFRVTLRNHTNLSNIADSKANILLSVNAIIISLALSTLIPKLDKASNSYLLIPTVIFMGFSVASIAFSVLATRPNVTRGRFTKEDVKNKKVNLLFFGNFHKMNLEDYEEAMKEVREDKEYLYNSLTKDLYFLGKVLDKKYRLLRITYTVFLVGIIVSVIAFGVATYYVNSGY
ncbi:Pycsar system effector family protein [Sinomicrobium weinanense]|uniref:HD domain-containing protein n=1 Tax=Sinomicrobium weinanense TaxID=2842200 RepID=A0A926Q0Y5_9FLAO|nr:Pycsar system effector family protein [Sinomicrobium weinanense]MBC9795173.1 HD domain-containing protein [Sinomicrobium weinanense]MBU3121950.1 HD domain-containing protein [Sinomicrobium weinanense]